MHATYHWQSGHWPLMGWLIVAIGVIAFLFGIKKREIVMPLACAVIGTVYLVAQLDDTLLSGLMVTIFAASAIDKVLILWKQKATRKTVALNLFPLALIPCIFFIAPQTNRDLQLDEHSLTLRYAGPGWKHWDDVRIPREEVAVTLIHASDAETDQWRFRSAAKPPAEIFINGSDEYKDGQGCHLNSDQVAREIVRWSGASVLEKSAPLNPAGP